jgi:AcrR family transcriptional regulator
MNVHLQAKLMARAIGVRARVERAAVELFAAKGVDGASIAEIAAAAGVSQGALYRHHRSKEELAATLFTTAYRRTGAELDAIRTTRTCFADRVAGMVEHFCTLYDTDAALFRFMLIAQHDLLPLIGGEERVPVAVLEDTVAEAVAACEIEPVDIAASAAVIMGVVLQPAVFHLYGRLPGPLLPHATALARAAIAAVKALSRPA